MGTALATVGVHNWVALKEGSSIKEAMDANLGEGAGLSERDLIQAELPTGANVGGDWIIPSITGNETCESIEGILVHVQRRGLLWPTFEPKKGTLPVLTTDDLEVARQVAAEIPQDMQEELARCFNVDSNTYDWNALTYNQFGTGKNGVGKRCVEQRLFFVLRETDPLPIVVTAGPGSLNKARDFLKKLSAAGIPYYKAVVKLTVTSETNANGIDYSGIKIVLIGSLSDEDTQRAKSYGSAFSGK